MGYMRHHGMLVTAWNKEGIDAAYKKAEELFQEVIVNDPDNPRTKDPRFGMISNVVDSGLNGYCSFAIFPDGSKEGWHDSEKGEEFRSKFIEYLREEKDTYIDWALVQYGDENWHTAVMDDSDRERREET